MENKIENRKELKKYYFTICLYFIIMTFEYISEYYSSHGIGFFTTYKYFARSICMVFPFVLLFQLKGKIKLTNYRVLFLAIFNLLIIITIINTVNDYIGNLTYLFIYESILSAFLISQLKSIPIEDILLETFKYIAIIALISLVYVFSVVGFDMNLVLGMHYSWGESFYYASLFWAIIPFVILSFIKKKYMKLSLLYWSGGILINFMLLKRYIVIDSLLILVVFFIPRVLSYKKINKRNILRNVSIVILVILVGSIIIYQNRWALLKIINALFARFNQFDNLSDFDRFQESVNYFWTATGFQVIFGKGFLGTHSGLGHVAYALHVGWCDFILKGGVILLGIVIYPYIKAMTLMWNIKKRPAKIQFAVSFLLIEGFRLIYLNMFSFSPDMLIFYCCIFLVADYNKKSRIGGNHEGDYNNR